MMPTYYRIECEDGETFSLIAGDESGSNVQGLAMTDPPTYYPSEWVDPEHMYRADMDALVGWFVHYDDLDTGERAVSSPIARIEVSQ